MLRLGITMPQLSPVQQLMRRTRVASTTGKVAGVITGCSLGLLNLLFIDTFAAEKAKEWKEFTAIFRTIMTKAHEVAECDAASLWIVDYDKRELWTRAMSGNQRQEEIRRPFGCGIVGAVAESGELSNVVDCYSHPNFDNTVDKDGITGFRSETILTCPVRDNEGKVIAVVQLVNKKKPTHKADGGLTGGVKGYFARRKIAQFDASDEKLIRMICHHVAVSMAQMENKIDTGEVDEAA